MKKYLVITMCCLLCLCGCGNATKEAKSTATPKPTADDLIGGATSKVKEVVIPDEPQMTYIGHSSIKIITKEGKVIYVDPSYDGDYGEPADYIFITHEHADHNDSTKVNTKDTTKEFHAKDFIDKGKYKTMELDGVKVTAVPAYNKSHSKKECVGYVLDFDGVKLYHAGDTGYMKEMKDFAKLKLDYALLPIDGKYDLNAKMAVKCVEAIKATHIMQIHTTLSFKEVNKETKTHYTIKNLLPVKVGETITLKGK